MDLVLGICMVLQLLAYSSCICISLYKLEANVGKLLDG